MMNKIPRIVIAATSSGSGKTTIVSGLLGAMRDAGKIVQSYKIGPDYIDPGYHQLASGRIGHNLDTWLVPAEKINEIFYKTAKTADIAIIEGVMGLYDGGRKGISSTAAIAKQLNAPVILVIDVKSMGDSAAAIALGFREYDHSLNLAGVILNRVGSKSHEIMVREAMAKINIPVLGAVYRDDALKMPERHLGLTPVSENNAEAVMELIKAAISRQVDLARLWQIAETAPPLNLPPVQTIAPKYRGLRIGVAQDEAFTFYYPESLQVLSDLGAEIISFSPLHDACLPKVDGLIIGGGFPEMFVSELAANLAMRSEIAAAGKSTMPIYAECGGLMYLTQQIEGFDGQAYDMVGLIPAKCQMNMKLQTVGYIEATSLQDHILCRQSVKVRGHEFHFSSMVVPPDKQERFPWAFEFVKTRTNAVYPSGYACGNVLASYLHLHFAGNPALAENFLAKCLAFQQGAEHFG